VNDTDWIHCNIYKVYVLRDVTVMTCQVCACGYILTYFGGAWLKSTPGHQLSWQVSWDFPQSVLANATIHMTFIRS